jgi:putative tryptophan/tyrosine transport system substrate-binding protein
MAHWRRREFIGLIGGAAAWPLAGHAQQPAGRPLIALLSPLSAALAARNIEAFLAGLRDLGYQEGRNIAIEYRFAEGAIGRLPDLAAELVALKPAAIVTGALPPVLAAREATRTIPIVMTAIVQDPVPLGLAASIARPGGNVTGFWIEGDEAMIAKRLELLKEATPRTSRVGVIVNPDNPTEWVNRNSLPAAALALGLTVRILEVRALAEFEAAFAAAVGDGLQGLHVSQDLLFNNYRTEIAAMAARARLPAIYAFREFVAAGGLMSYAASLPDAYRRCAALVDKILKGAHPGDLPIERPTKFELVLNLRAAKALGLELPPTLLARADEVIE